MGFVLLFWAVKWPILVKELRVKVAGKQFYVCKNSCDHTHYKISAKIFWDA